MLTNVNKCQMLTTLTYSLNVNVVSVVNIAFLIIFAVFDPSPLTMRTAVFTFIFAVLLPVLSRLLIMSITNLLLNFSIFQDGGHPPW